jgi:hypothetical protein
MSTPRYSIIVSEKKKQLSMPHKTEAPYHAPKYPQNGAENCSKIVGARRRGRVSA